jgi:2-amino-4-hydroxy-6-hydroxymethyldihydropteridine diphosphokinase
MPRYAVAVGSNRGDRTASIAAAASLVEATGLARVTVRSGLIETAPVGGPRGQGAFLNGAWIVASALGPHQLLHLLQRVESALGRTRTVPWGPRTIDLDLLLREDALAVSTPVLTLPHPRLAGREFVLRPLAEIAAGWRVPPGGATVAELLQRLIASAAG